MIEINIPANEIAVIDTAWCLSQINRRAYRQGYEYAYDKLELFQMDTSTQSNLTVYTMNQTWVTVNAWVKAFHAWNDQQQEAMRLAGTQSMRAKYRDFKICYNEGHATGSQGGVTVTQPTPSGALTLANAQTRDAGASMAWEYAQFVLPNTGGNTGVTQEVIGYMLGKDSTTSRSLIQAYAESRARPDPTDPSTVTSSSPNYPDGGLYTEMIDVGEDMEEIMDNVTDRNNEAPYIIASKDSDKEFYPGGSMGGYVTADEYPGMQRDRLIVRASTAGTNNPLSTDVMGGFTAYCGLIMLHNDGDYQVQVRLHCTAGDYQGVAARPMQDVN